MSLFLHYQQTHTHTHISYASLPSAEPLHFASQFFLFKASTQGQDMNHTNTLFRGVLLFWEPRVNATPPEIHVFAVRLVQLEFELHPCSSDSCRVEKKTPSPAKDGECIPTKVVTNRHIRYLVPFQVKSCPSFTMYFLFQASEQGNRVAMGHCQWLRCKDLTYWSPCPNGESPTKLNRDSNVPKLWAK